VLLASNVAAHWLLEGEVAFLADVAPGELRAFWRDMRNRALALAADLPLTAESIALLERRLRTDEALLAERRGNP
jgi:hypothetical protein